jgi:SAM-dependent methyltransferase
MKSREDNPDRELYRQLRGLSCKRLWEDEVPRFDRATPQERIERVAVIRAVGVVFSESGSTAQKDQARPWLRGLLHDPCEKIRRYAMAALPKIGSGASEERELLSLLRTTVIEREKKFLSQTLEKIGGTATLKEMEQGTGGLLSETEQKIKASLALNQSPGAVRMDRVLANFAGVRIHLRGRAGLERIVRDEVDQYIQTHGKFRIAEVRTGLVAILPVAPFTLADVYSLRCFGTVGLVPGFVSIADGADSAEALASMIAAPLSRRILETFTEGPVRYRLDFVGKGHQRGAVRLLASRVYALCPELLNSSRNALWTIAIRSIGRVNSVELCPMMTPDPRFCYRQHDLPAASHPPLAAAMARLAGRVDEEIVWDPFCGSGLELIERALLGGVRRVHGTDLSAEAIAAAQNNFAAANLPSVQAQFTRSDFRDFAAIKGLGRDSVTLVVTNPPMGKRVPIGNLGGLIKDLFFAAATVLQPGGRLVFANPMHLENPHRSLKLQFRQVVDLGGFDCRLEMYRKLGR